MTLELRQRSNSPPFLARELVGQLSPAQGEIVARLVDGPIERDGRLAVHVSSLRKLGLPVRSGGGGYWLEPEVREALRASAIAQSRLARLCRERRAAVARCSTGWLKPLPASELSAPVRARFEDEAAARGIDVVALVHRLLETIGTDDLVGSILDDDVGRSVPSARDAVPLNA